MTLSHKPLIEQIWHEVWNDGTFTTLEASVSPGYRRTNRGTGESLDLEGFRRSVQDTREAFPDLTTHVDAIVEEGDRVAVFWTSRGTHHGRLLDIPATQRQVSTSGSNLCFFEGEHLVSEEVTWDVTSMLRALGITTLGGE